MVGGLVGTTYLLAVPLVAVELPEVAASFHAEQEEEEDPVRVQLMGPLDSLEAREVEWVAALHAGQQEFEVPVRVQLVVPLVALEAPEVEQVGAPLAGEEE